MKLAEWAVQYGPNSEQVGKKQYILLKSLDFRILAIDISSTSSGRNTPGVDGLIFDPEPQAKMKMVEELRNLSEYKTSPVRRVYIPKTPQRGNGKMRPLGIPTY